MYVSLVFLLNEPSVNVWRASESLSENDARSGASKAKRWTREDAFVSFSYCPVHSVAPTKCKRYITYTRVVRDWEI